MLELAQEFIETHRQVPTALQQEGGIYLLRTGRNVAKPHYAVGPRTIECYSFHFIMEGSLEFIDGNRKYELQAGQLFCLFPHATYSYRKLGTEEERLSMCWLAMTGAQAALMVKELGLSLDHPYMAEKLGKRIMALAMRIHRSMGEDYFMQQSLLYELFSLLRAVRAEGEPAPSKENPLDWLHDCRRYMELHYSEAVRVEEMAHEFGVHRSYFSSAFRQEFGMSPKQYLTRLRMEKAKELLHETDFPVNEIALTVGYPDPFSFTRAFINYDGRSPTDYRGVRHGSVIQARM